MKKTSLQTVQFAHVPEPLHIHKYNDSKSFVTNKPIEMTLCLFDFFPKWHVLVFVRNSRRLSFFGDGPVHILPYDPQCHELFAIYYVAV
jgi:hypothetical protein